MEKNKYPSSCPECQKPYSFSLIPYELPCGHSFCDKCIKQTFKKQKKLICFTDKETFSLKLKDLSIPFFYGRIVKEQSDLPNKNYLCSYHPNETIKFYCALHNEYLCCMCIFEHSDHKEFIEVFREEIILEEIKRFEKGIDYAMEKLKILKERLQQIKLKNICQSKDFMSVFNTIEKVLPIVKKKDHNLLQNPHIFWESKILLKAPNRKFIHSLFPENYKILTKLIYRGSRDGFDSQTFHNMCDAKGASLVIVSSTNDHFFGGFNPISWECSEEGIFKSTADSFLFSLNRMLKFEIGNPKNAVFNYDNIGPAFGERDLYISSGCNKNQISYSQVGNSYCSNSSDKEEKKICLAGTPRFQVEDYEVFSVILMKNE